MNRLIAAVAIGLMATQAQAAEPVGFAELAVAAPHHGSVMGGAVWYPPASGGVVVTFGGPWPASWAFELH
jgi:hypothetical protein